MILTQKFWNVLVEEDHATFLILKKLWDKHCSGIVISFPGADVVVSRGFSVLEEVMFKDNKMANTKTAAEDAWQNLTAGMVKNTYDVFACCY